MDTPTPPIKGNTPGPLVGLTTNDANRSDEDPIDEGLDSNRVV